MITPRFPRPLIVAALYLCFSWSLSAQDNHAWQSILSGKTPTATTTVASACDPDVTAPEVHCPTGKCLPTARAAYLISTSGEPFGSKDNLVAMEAVFGAGNWDAFYLESPDATLLSPAYKVIFLEGSGYGGYALDAFLTAHLPALENWVAAGGALFINSASVNSPSYIQLGFGGVVLENYVARDEGIVQVPGHAIFNTPFTPANGFFTGIPFSYAIISGPAGTALITDAGGTAIILSEKTWGAGKVFFGGMMPAYWHEPHTNDQHMRQNILADLNNRCNSSVIVAADAGACTATVANTALNATATDDCNLVSLTHDFVAAPANTSLSGAILPSGPTLIRWTATDAAGNTATCEFTVMVREPDAPVLVCPANLSVPANAGSCGAVVNFAATATDNCTPALTVTTAPATGTVFANGTTTVQAYATDASGNPGTCSFTVTVVPNPELCNGLDDDCNGLTDDGAPADNTYYADTDGDGYGDPNSSVLDCPAPSGYVANALDCNDTDYYIQPGMTEYCNGIDDDCDGTIDEGAAPTWYADADGDGHGNPNATQLSCNQPAGYSYYAGDCDDTNAYIHPGAQEDCTNFVDENCDGILGSNAFSVSETHTDVYCGSSPDGSISITMSPVQNYTQILWSNGVCCTTTQTNLQAGTYRVTVTNECGTTRIRTVTLKTSTTTPALRVLMSGTQPICAGDGLGSVTATPADGCAGYTYAWNTGSTDATLTGLSGGTYSVIVTDGCGCTKTGTFEVNEPAPLQLYSGAIVALLDGTYWMQVIPYGGTSPYKFRRSIPAGGVTPWSISNGFGDVPPGDYTFEVEDKNGCAAQVIIYLEPFSPRPGRQPVVELPDHAESAAPAGERLPSAVDSRQQPALSGSLEEPVESVLVFPNPTDDILNIEWTGEEGKSATIQIISQLGQVVRTLPVPENALRIQTSVNELPAGLYFVKIVTNGRPFKAVRLVKT